MSDSSDSEGELATLFACEDTRSKAFTFVSMTLSDCDCLEPHLFTNRATKVTFHFTYDSTSIFSYLIIPFENSFSTVQYRLLLYIGMNVLTWYWMGYATYTINITAAPLNALEIEYFEDLYNNVLQEYMFVNKLRGKIKIVSTFARDTETQLSALPENINRSSNLSTILVPLGGGKDSLTVWERAVVSGNRVKFLYVSDGLYEYEGNSRLSSIVEICTKSAENLETPEGMDASKNIAIFRHDFHSRTFESTAHSMRPCGHPWASLCIFDALLAASLLDIPTIWMGFESSADQGNGMSFNDISVNHQFDKSAYFMNATKDFISHLYAPSTEPVLHSPLSKTSELLISRQFALSPLCIPLHKYFMSCNSPLPPRRLEGEDQWNWCNKCEKCIFIFLLLSSWIPPSAVTEIFGGINLFDAAHGEDAEARTLMNMFHSLIGSPNTVKPFECVGTSDEGRAAVELSVEQYLMQANGEIPPALKELYESVLANEHSSETAEDEVCRNCAVTSDMSCGIAQGQSRILSKYSLL